MPTDVPSFVLPAGPAEYRIAMTPEMAAEIVTSPLFRGPNRRFNAGTAARYARIMAAGNWVFNGEAIKFAADGSVLDGQHRLAACVESGVTIDVLIITGLPKSAQDTMDTGRGRTAGDVLAIHGYQGAVSSTAAATRILIAREAGTLTVNARNPEITHGDIYAYCEQHPDVTWAVQHIGHPGKLPLRLSVFIAAYILMHRVDAEAAEEFRQGFVSGAGLAKGNPILTLRDRLLAAQLRREKLSAYIELSALLRGWNAWRTGAPMSQFLLHARNGIVPVPEVLR